jgi:hypothetical protein
MWQLDHNQKAVACWLLWGFPWSVLMVIGISDFHISLGHMFYKYWNRLWGIKKWMPVTTRNISAVQRDKCQVLYLKWSLVGIVGIEKWAELLRFSNLSSSVWWNPSHAPNITRPYALLCLNLGNDMHYPGWYSPLWHYLPVDAMNCVPIDGLFHQPVHSLDFKNSCFLFESLLPFSEATWGCWNCDDVVR